MPIVKSNYRPPTYLFSRHLQTVAPFILVKPDNTLYQTEKFELSDGDFLELDWIKSKSDRLMILCHGLEGNSRSHYVQQMATHFSKLGWDILAINVRGCGRKINRLPVLYHAGATNDIEEVVSTYAQKYKAVTLVGFSFGANMLLNFASRHTVPKNVCAVAGFSVPCDIKGAEKKLDRVDNRIYSKKFLEKLKNRIRKLENLHPDVINAKDIDKINSLQSFTRKIASPYCGFNSVEDYYAAGSCLTSLRNAKLPTLVVNAQNDPFLSKSCYPTKLAQSSSVVFFDNPNKGGHSSFPINGKESWMPKKMQEFLEEIVPSI